MVNQIQLFRLPLSLRKFLLCHISASDVDKRINLACKGFMQLTFGWCIIGGVFICGSLQIQQLPLTCILSALYVLMVRSHFHGHLVICNRGRFVGYHRIFLLPYMYSISICNLLCCHPFLTWSMEIVPSMEMHFFLMQIMCYEHHYSVVE
jgi:hypothetical protein